VPGTLAADGEELDAYLTGLAGLVSEAIGVCVAIVQRLDEDDPKLVVAADGGTLSDERIRRLVSFQEGDRPYRIVRAEENLSADYNDRLMTPDAVSRNGLDMTFHGWHRPLEAYSRALEAAGLSIEAIREHAVPADIARSERSKRWRRVPLFLHLRARKDARR
jgi:hypothetical protein